VINKEHEVPNNVIFLSILLLPPS